MAKDNRHLKPRSLRLEGLESRQMMTGDADLTPTPFETLPQSIVAGGCIISPWHNVNQAADVDGDQLVTPSDANAIVNHLLLKGPHAVQPGEAAPGYLDANNDHVVDLLDARLVIDRLSNPERTQNHSPTLQALADQLATEGDTIVVQLQAADVDGDGLKYTVNSGGYWGPLGGWVPNGPLPATVDVSGDRITIKPNAGFVGSFYVNVEVSDGIGTASHGFQVYVKGAKADYAIRQGQPLTVDGVGDPTGRYSVNFIMPYGAEQPAQLTLKQGQLVVAPRAGFHGTFSVEVRDISLMDAPSRVVKTLTFEVAAAPATFSFRGQSTVVPRGRVLEIALPATNYSDTIGGLRPAIYRPDEVQFAYAARIIGASGQTVPATATIQYRSVDGGGPWDVLHARRPVLVIAPAKNFVGTFDVELTTSTDPTVVLRNSSVAGAHKREVFSVKVAAPETAVPPGTSGSSQTSTTQPNAGGTTSTGAAGAATSAVQVVQGTLVITGTNGADTVTVTENPTAIVVTAGTSGGVVATQQSFPKAGITSIRFTGGNGDDVFSNLTSLASSVDGGAGNDKLTGGSGVDQVLGGDGNDEISGSAGDDYLSGGNGDDTLRGGDGNDQIHGDAGNDYLAGNQGADRLFGGDGNDGIHGGDGGDSATGGNGADRFLEQSGDTTSDVAAEDARVIFNDTAARSWTDDEIERVDGAFRTLQNRTGNTHLLKDPVTDVPIRFTRVDSIPDAAANNTDPMQRYVIHGPINEVVNNRTPTRVIRFSDNAFGDLASVVWHEIGHNWDGAKEITQVLPALKSLWDAFARINAQAGNNLADFVSQYARDGGVQEDFAETFSTVLAAGAMPTSTLITQRFALINQLFNALAGKGSWDGHSDDTQIIKVPAPWEEAWDAFVDFLGKLDPSQIKLSLPQFDGEALRAFLSRLDPTKIRELLPTLDSSMLASVLGGMNPERLNDVLAGLDSDALDGVLASVDPSQLGNVLNRIDSGMLSKAASKLDPARIAQVFGSLEQGAIRTIANSLDLGKLGQVMDRVGAAGANKVISELGADRAAAALSKVSTATLKSVFATLSTNSAADLLERVDGSTLKAALDGLKADRAAQLLEKVDGDTLKAAMDRLGTARAADLLERVDGNTLKAALNRVGAGRAAELLEKVDGDTLKAALTRLSTSRAAELLEKVDGSTLKAALTRLSTSRAAELLEKVDGGTLKAAFNRLSTARATELLKKVDDSTFKAAMKRLDPSRASELAKDVGRGAKSVVDKGRKILGL